MSLSIGNEIAFASSKTFFTSLFVISFCNETFEACDPPIAIAPCVLIPRICSPEIPKDKFSIDTPDIVRASFIACSISSIRLSL